MKHPKLLLWLTIASLVGSIDFARAATGLTDISYTRATQYTDDSALAPADITGHGIVCTFTPTGGTTAPCVFAPTSFGGAAVSGRVTLTYPPVGGRVCIQVKTLTATTESAPSPITAQSCKDLAAAPRTPRAPTDVTVTVTISVN